MSGGSTGGATTGGGTAGGTTAGGTTASGGGTGAAADTSAGSEGAAAETSEEGGATGAQPVGEVPAGGAPANCRSDGRQPGFGVFMPPCQPKFTGDNGGETGQGVFRDKIIVVRYIAQSNPAVDAALVAAGATDERGDTDRMTKHIVRYMNTHFETWGREVQVITMDGSGQSSNDAAMRADSAKIADEIRAFAVLGGPRTMAEELAARGIICMCTTSLGRSFYQKTQGYIFATLPVLEEYYVHAAEYLGKRLNGRNAKWAGDAIYTAQPRKFGLIYAEADSAGKVIAENVQAKQFFEQELARYGASLTKSVGYAGDINRAQEQATSIVTQLKNAGVSTVVFSGDPLAPIFITQEATRQRYFPEWINLGTALTDTTFFGRTYDKAQMAHMFGISPLYVFWTDVSGSPGYVEYHHAYPDSNRGDEGVSINVLRAAWELFFIGVHMAGPNLNSATFAQGMYAYPPTDGEPKNPLYYFTPESPMAYKDFTEIFWDQTWTAKDETSKDGVGVFLKATMGKRYAAGEWPDTEPNVFVREGSIYTTDDPPSVFDHDADGHTHFDDPACLSCTHAAS